MYFWKRGIIYACGKKTGGLRWEAVAFIWKAEKIIFTIIFVLSFLSYIDLVFDVTLFKYVPLSDIFLQERFHSRAINYIPFSDWYVDRSGMFRDIFLNVVLFFPFGFLLQMMCKKNKICTYPIAIPFIVSVAIEVLSMYFPLGLRI